MNQKIAIAILGIIVVILAGTTIYFATSKKTAPPVATVVEETRQSAKPTVAEDVNCETGSKVFFEVKEMGVKFLVDEDIKDDLIYEYSAPRNYDLGSAMFSAKSLVAMDAGCSAKEGALFGMSKLKGSPTDEIYGGYYRERMGDIKQFDGYFITHSGPQALCALNERSALKINDYANQLKKKIFLEEVVCIREME